MHLKLTTWQRVSLVGQIDQMSGGTVGTMRLAIQAIDILTLSKEERSRVGYVASGGVDRWTDTEVKFEIEFKDPGMLTIAKRAAESLVRSIEGVERWNLAMLADSEDLCKQLKIDFDTIVESVVKQKQAREEPSD